MEKPILTLTSKNWLTGIGPGAHFARGGVFFKADGITPLFEAGASQSVNNGLLMPGASATTVGGTPNGNFISSTKALLSSAKAYFGTSTSHLFSLTIDPTFSASLSDDHTAGHQLTHGLETFQPAAGTAKLYYWQIDQIGTFDFVSTYTDNALTAGIQTDYIHASHKYFKVILYGNGFGKVGRLQDDGAGGVTNTTGALLIPPLSIVTDISDDGTYAAIAITNNVGCDPNALADTRIIFWDGFDSQWLREWPVSDPFIYALEKTPIGLFAYGVTGVWEVTFGGGARKIETRSPGLYSVNSYNTLKYGRGACSHYGDALMWGGSSGSNTVIKSMGKLDTGAPAAYLHPFVSTANKNVTLVDAQLLKGYVFVGDDTPLLKAYPFSTANTPQTGNTAQTVYFSLPTKMSIKRIDVVFGEPLASGDSFSLGAFKDQDTAATTFGTATFAANGAIRRKSMYPTNSLTVEDQFSILLTFTAGAVKVKAIEVYGESFTP